MKGIALLESLVAEQWTTDLNDLGSNLAGSRFFPHLLPTIKSEIRLVHNYFVLYFGLVSFKCSIML